MLNKFLLIIILMFATPIIASGQTAGSNDEYFPLIRVVPQYPLRAMENKVEGYVVLSFTVDSKGVTKDVKVTESSHRMFERNAVKAAQKYKYRPRKVDGVAIEVHDVQVRIDFTLG